MNAGNGSYYSVVFLRVAEPSDIQGWSTPIYVQYEMGYYFTPRSYDYKTSLGINGIDEGRSIFVLDNNITCTDDNYERLYQKVGRCDEALNPIIEQANAECYNDLVSLPIANRLTNENIEYCSFKKTGATDIKIIKHNIFIAYQYKNFRIVIPSSKRPIARNLELQYVFNDTHIIKFAVEVGPAKPDPTGEIIETVKVPVVEDYEAFEKFIHNCVTPSDFGQTYGTEAPPAVAESKSQGLSVKTIVGIACGALAVLICLACISVVVVVYKRKGEKKNKKATSKLKSKPKLPATPTSSAMSNVAATNNSAIKSAMSNVSNISNAGSAHFSKLENNEDGAKSTPVVRLNSKTLDVSAIGREAQREIEEEEKAKAKVEGKKKKPIKLIKSKEEYVNYP